MLKMFEKNDPSEYILKTSFATDAVSSFVQIASHIHEYAEKINCKYLLVWVKLLDYSHTNFKIIFIYIFQLQDSQRKMDNVGSEIWELVYESLFIIKDTGEIN